MDLRTLEQAYSLDSKVALVTGASRGIGAAIADRLAAHGAIVFGTATSEAGAAEISARLGGGRGRVLDVNDVEAVATLVAAISADASAPTVLVNNAAITRDQLLLRLRDEDWYSVIETNLTGVMRMSRACLKGMLKAREGRIVSISSVVGYSGNPGQTITRRPRPVCRAFHARWHRRSRHAESPSTWSRLDSSTPT